MSLVVTWWIRASYSTSAVSLASLKPWLDMGLERASLCDGQKKPTVVARAIER
jgi:hypothetical protein